MTQWTGSDEAMTEDDQRSPAKGFAIGLALSVAFWTALIVMMWP